MRLLDDERGQSVQVGAAILLGFVVIAITLYQVEVVSSQNAEVEFNHDQEIRDQLTELRNSINNAGTQGLSDSVSVKLGGQYPPRTIFVNPPPIQGALQTQQAGNISFGNAQVQGSYRGSGDATELVSGNHTTNRLVYVPRYFELDDVGVTSIEHSLAFKAFENNATDPLTRQRVVRGDSLTLTVLQGNVSEQGTQSISLDLETVSGPTDPISIEPANSSEPIEVYLPTETPSVWNDTIGTEYGDNDVRVAGYDGSRALLELDRDEYELQMALVDVGDGVSETDQYNVTDADSGGSGRSAGNGSYSLTWTDPSSESSNTGMALSDCDSSSCTWDVGASTYSSLTLNSTLAPPFEGIDLEFAVDDSSVGTLSSTTGTTGSDGTERVSLTAQENGTVDILSSANDDSDVIEMSIVNVTGDGGTGPTTSAEQMELVSNSGGVFWGGPGVAFQVENNGSDDVTISAVTINDTSAGSAVEVAESETGSYSQGHHEVYIDADTDGVLDMNGQPYYEDAGDPLSFTTTESMTEEGLVGGRNTATVNIHEFVNNGGNSVDMSGSTVTVTLHFSDGTQDTYTVQA